MSKVGRKSKSERELEPQYSDIADLWLQKISLNYIDYKERYICMARQKGYTLDEDLFENTVMNCYDAIARNGLKDQSEQGCKNYLFRSFFTNINAVSNYDKRKDKNIEDLSERHERYELQGQSTYSKTKEQLMNDYMTIWILDKVEQNFPTIDFHLFKLKYLIDKMTYDKLKQITHVKDCKKRIVKINKWIKDNLLYQDAYRDFIMDFPDFED